MSRTVARRFVPALIGSCLVAALVAAQDPPKEPQQPSGQQPPIFRTEVNFVSVDVYPTAAGRHVGDLTRDDFEILEEGKPQRIETFEHIMVRPAGAQAARAEPNSQREGNQMAEDPRARVFVLFLDTYHVEDEASHRVRRPLVTLLDRIIGQDDLVGVMTPEMSAANLVLGRRTLTIEDMLTRHWNWGRRTDITARDPDEERYEACFGGRRFKESEFVVREMIGRRREKLTLDALADLVRHLRALREERKAILAITDGWILYKPNRALADALTLPNGQKYAPGPPVVYVGEGGRMRMEGKPGEGEASMFACDRDRMNLAMLDNERQFRELLDESNRSNATFYPVDPRGLAVFDTPIGPERPLPPAQDRGQLANRISTLRTLAEATDGIAVLNSNDIEGGLKRVADDLTAYYLLGYYSSNTNLDGKYRSISVRVKRPDVQVRARRGYRAARAAEVVDTPAPANGNTAPSRSPEDEAVASALGSIGVVRAGTKLLLRGAPVRGSDTTAALIVVGEIDYTVSRSPAWVGGGVATVQLVRDRSPVTSTDIPLAPGSRTFVARLPSPEPGLPNPESRAPNGGLSPGTYSVSARIRSFVTGALPLSDAVSVTVPEPAPADVMTGDVLWFRRGPSTGVSYMATADVRFRRNELIRVEVPVKPDADRLAMRLLDRQGGPMQVPLASSDRADETARWAVGNLSLAPLATGDYLVEITASLGGQTQKVLAGFKVVP
ncbi:MAG: VWA domain-containing protein [Acidobacteria bacterium]|nr:VWA domain-containing protein [Acidobacteriota bacterium]